MKLLSLVIVAVVTSLTSAYDLTFTVQLDGPSESNCNSNDMRKIARRLEKALEQKGNRYLQVNSMPGILTDISLIAGNYDRQLNVIRDDELTSHDVMIQQQREHRRLGFTWSGTGKCNGCPPDNGDGRRSLRALERKGLSRFNVNEFVNDEMAVESSGIYRTSGLNKSCQASDAWTTSFNWV
jgi:hypothetical protein